MASSLLQSGLDKLSVWAKDWQIQISIPKCSVLHMGNNSAVSQYNIDGNVLPNVTAMRDLGVTIDCDLRFKLHISNIVAKAHQRACLILRCFKSRNADILFRAFIVYVRPLLEYCASVWSPCYISDILKIESVQRRFTKRLKSMWFRSYCDRLNILATDSLQVRRLKADLTMIFKIVNDFVDIDDKLFVPSLHSINLRRHNKYLLKPSVNCNCRAFSFACRCINIWNALPSSVVNCSSVSSFKRKLALIDFDHCLPVSFS